MAVLVAALLGLLCLTVPLAWGQGQPAPGPAAPAAEQVLTWTAGDSYTGYLSAPSTAVAGAATIVFENSAATGNTTGMPHTLTFDTSNTDYNTDVTLNLVANPADANGGRETAQVTLSPGTYRYFCAMPGHLMSGELTVTAAGGGDTTAPQASAAVTGDKNADGQYTGTATVTLTATDTESGVDHIDYTLDGGTSTAYTTPIAVTTPGDHTLTYRATDKAGNTSADQTTTFTIATPTTKDTTPPQTSATVTGDKNADGQYTGTATVTLTATDTESGVDHIDYTLDGGTSTAYTTPIAVTTPGDHTLTYRATDKAGNTSADQTTTFTIATPTTKDTTPPQTSATVTGDKNADGQYIDTATVTLSASDTESGVDRIQYSLDGGAYQTYTAPVAVSTSGDHTLTYRATDKAGNTSADQTTTFTVAAPPAGDTTAPQASAAVTGTQNAAWQYVGSATVTITATDDKSGVDRIEYSLDGGPYLVYTAPVVVDRAGDHAVRYRAVDKAGNTSAVATANLTVVDSRSGGGHCAESDNRATVIVGTVNSGVPNRVTGNGCTINERILDEQAWKSHDAFVDHVKHLTDALLHEGVIDRREAKAINTAASRSDIGKPGHDHGDRAASDGSDRLVAR
ncbi:OmpL47-type beta-barrel domain-containing protein [Peterkaempfera sp. SMS 1(5)a]|uniref:OmpL47-type beta-barrel domain-containing protein n=1 Tax=Peterkaempfera podocarpi TaxID=3232308 RepID=UPI00366FF8D4